MKVIFKKSTNGNHFSGHDPTISANCHPLSKTSNAWLSYQCYVFDNHNENSDNPFATTNHARNYLITIGKSNMRNLSN